VGERVTTKAFLNVVIKVTVEIEITSYVINAPNAVMFFIYFLRLHVTSHSLAGSRKVVAEAFPSCLLVVVAFREPWQAQRSTSTVHYLDFNKID
jgi:hypothetical protein